MNVPIIISPDNPVGADKAVSELQTAIKDVFFFESDGTTPRNWFKDGLVFPLVRRDETTGEPILYWKGKDYFKTIPEDTFGAYSFFYETDPRNIAGEDFAVYSFNLIVWFDEDHIKQGLQFRIREFFINDIIQALQATLEDEDINSITVFTTPENVFSDFVVQLENPQFKAPYDGFRISFNYTSPTDCGVRLVLPTD